MKDYTKNRGWRNNNPLNIRRSKDDWQGSVPKEERKDKAFVEFTEMKWGYRAAFVILENYWKSMKDAFTISGIISKWAPESDGNDTDSYIQDVVKWSGLGQKGKDGKLAEPLSPEGKEDIIRVAWAMTMVECGVPANKIPYAAVEEGWKEAAKTRKAPSTPQGGRKKSVSKTKTKKSKK